PVQPAGPLHPRGYDKVTVYNFGIEGALLGSELTLLKRFRETYALDQVLFYTGGNDVLASYSDRVPGTEAWTGLTNLELVRAAKRLAATLAPGGPMFDAAERERARRSNRLGDGITAAGPGCGAPGTHCERRLR